EEPELAGDDHEGPAVDAGAARQHRLPQPCRLARGGEPLPVRLRVREAERVVGDDVRVPCLEAALVGDERDARRGARRTGLHSARHGRIVERRSAYLGGSWSSGRCADGGRSSRAGGSSGAIAAGSGNSTPGGISTFTA